MASDTNQNGVDEIKQVLQSFCGLLLIEEKAELVWASPDVQGLPLQPFNQNFVSCWLLWGGFI